VPALHETLQTKADGSGDRPVASAAGPVASRLSYELSRAPSERPRAAVAEPTTPATAAAGTPPGEPALNDYVANARPISTVPPEPRDRTREIQKEAQNPQYREAPRAANASGGRVFEGRDVTVKPRAESSRPVLPGESAPAKTPESSAANPASVATGAPGQLQSPVAIDPGPESSAPLKSPEASASPPLKTGAGDEIESRFQATRDWLATAAHSTHTIQLMGASNEAQLASHLHVLLKLLESGKVYVFRTIAQGKPSITVIYGAYPDRQSALTALDDLPAAAAAYRPVLRTVSGIRAELKQHGFD
jgi:septal ring-binding cell division protein DamX